MSLPVVAGATFVVVTGLFARRGRLPLALTLGALAAWATWLVAAAAPADVDTTAKARPTDGTLYRPEFSSSSSCQACHPGEAASWHKSFHRTMTQPANAQTIRAPFAGQSFAYEGKRYSVMRDDDGKFFIDMPRLSTSGTSAADRMRREVVMVTGSHHMQAYWISMETALTDVEERGRRQFNTRCASCHGENAEGGTADMLVGQRRLSTELAPKVQEALFGRHGDTADAGVDEVGDEGRHHEVRDVSLQQEVLAYVTRVQFDGRMMQFPLVYLLDDQRWIHEEDSFLQPPREPDALERPGDRWGFNCDECHSVGPSFGWIGDEVRARSSAVELGISCEACHGPGRAHIERYRDVSVRYAAAADEQERHAKDDMVNPADLDHKLASHICAQCHADLERSGAGYLPFLPGEDLDDMAYLMVFDSEDKAEWPEWIADLHDDEPDRVTGTAWPDGTVRVAGRMYNGMALSGCTTRGTMGCTSCHSMHHAEDVDDQLLPEATRIRHADGTVDETPTDALCVQCHEREANMGEQHTHHPLTSSGSRCLNCHMPQTTYGLLTAMRSHRVDSPRAKPFAPTRRPQACALCHLDQTQAALGAKLTEWYGQPEVALDDDDKRLANGVRMVLEGDAVVRAVAAHHLGWPEAVEASRVDGKSTWRLPLFAELLDDDYVAVRQVAERSLKKSAPGLLDEGVDLRGWTMPYPAEEADRAQVFQLLMKAHQRQGGTWPQRLWLDDDGWVPAALDKVLGRDDQGVRINE